MKIEVEGGLEIAATLRELGDDKAVRSALRNALRAAALPMRDAAKNRVPVDQGDLQRSIKIGPRRRRSGEDPDTLGVLIGIDANEQPAKEVPRKTRSGRSTTYRDPGVAGVGPITEFGRPGEAAKPFMRPAFDAEGEKTIQRFGHTAGPAIEKQAARIARKRAKG